MKLMRNWSILFKTGTMIKSPIKSRNKWDDFFDLIDSLENAKLSSATVRKHIGNCWAIGFLECQYGYHEKFSIKRFEHGDAMHEYEFRRKFSDSDYAMKSYASTWKKLAQFVKTYNSEIIE